MKQSAALCLLRLFRTDPSVIPSGMFLIFINIWKKKIDEQDGYMNERTYERMKFGRMNMMDIWMNEWMELRMDGRIDALTQEQIESFTDRQTVLYMSYRLK